MPHWTPWRERPGHEDASGQRDGTANAADQRLDVSDQLAGLVYRLKDLTSGKEIPVSTFQDWWTATFEPGHSDWTTPAAAALASGANAMGIAARRLDRSAEHAGYAEAGLEGFPADGLIWYTDGGTTNN